MTGLGKIRWAKALIEEESGGRYQFVVGNVHDDLYLRCGDKTNAGLHLTVHGDIVRLGLSNGTVSVQKVDIIEIGDQSPEAVEAYVRAAFKTMSDDTRLSLISDLTALLQQKKEG